MNINFYKGFGETSKGERLLKRSRGSNFEAPRNEEESKGAEI